MNKYNSEKHDQKSKYTWFHHRGLLRFFFSPSTLKIRVLGGGGNRNKPLWSHLRSQFWKLTSIVNRFWCHALSEDVGYMLLTHLIIMIYSLKVSFSQKKALAGNENLLCLHLTDIAIYLLLLQVLSSALFRSTP